jgi:hypothetical protein
MLVSTRGKNSCRKTPTINHFTKVTCESSKLEQKIENFRVHLITKTHSGNTKVAIAACVRSPFFIWCVPGSTFSNARYMYECVVDISFSISPPGPSCLAVAKQMASVTCSRVSYLAPPAASSLDASDFHKEFARRNLKFHQNKSPSRRAYAAWAPSRKLIEHSAWKVLGR